MDTTRDLMTPEQVAQYLQVKVSTVYRLIRQRALAAAKIGRAYRIPRPAVESFVTSHTGTDAAGLPLYGPLTLAEQMQMLETISRLRQKQVQILAARGGEPFESSTELLREIREERTRELMGD